MEPAATTRIASFFEVLSMIELVLARLLIFALFVYGAYQFASKLHNYDQPPTSVSEPMSRPTN